MAGVKIQDFGGMFPSVPARALNESASQTASDLMSDAKEFRPLGQDTTVVANSGVTNPLTIYRLARTAAGAFTTDMTTNWIVDSVVKNYVKGPVNDDATERTYYTYGDGSLPPRVRDVNGVDRILGVPAPETPPVTEVNEVDEFTTDDRAAGLEAARQTAIAAVRENVTAVWRGAPSPGTGTTGYGDLTSTNGFGIPNPAMQVRVYRLTGAGGTISDSYTSLDDSYFTWIFDPQLQGFQGPSIGTSPAWAGSAGTYHYCIAYYAYGLTYDIDTSALQTALLAIDMPGKDDGTKLFTAGQVTEMINELVAFADYDGDIVGPMIDALEAKVVEVKALLDGGPRASLTAQTTAFYSKTDVAAAVTSAKQNFVNTVWNQAYLVARSSTPVDYIGAGAAPDGQGGDY
jgi:hypothetical protein